MKARVFTPSLHLIRHCEERSDAAIQPRHGLPRFARNDDLHPRSAREDGWRAHHLYRHCEERSDAAIQAPGA